jgi:nicotinamidase-related amidase
MLLSASSLGLVGLTMATVSLPQTALASDTHGLASFLRKLQDGETDATASPLTFDPMKSAIVLTDPQNDFLSPDGATWGVVGASVIEHNTRENIGRLLVAAKELGFLVFVSPHYYYPSDHDWEFGGTVEILMHNIGMFDREGPLSVEGFEGSGADWLEPYKEYFDQDNVIVTSPHKVYGPEQNDLALQMRKRGIDRVILGGMSANLCVESHMRGLLEDGFDVTVVSDATAAANIPGLGDGYDAAITNFKFIANAVVTTDEGIEAMGGDPSMISFDLQLKSRMALMFRGASVNVGTIADVNARFGTTVDPVEVFGEGNFGVFRMCLETPMLNPTTSEQVGTGTDCIYAVEGGVAGITFFNFENDNCGVLVHAAFTSMGQYSAGMGTGPITGDGPDVDTLSGAMPTDGVNTIVQGTGGFLNMTGNARLSGSLHMATEPAWLNCIWEVSLDEEPSCGLPEDRSSSRYFTDKAAIMEARTHEAAIMEARTHEVPADGDSGEMMYSEVHALVKFDGKAVAIGGLEKANALAGGVNVTAENAFGEEMAAQLGDFAGCHSVKMVDLASERRIGTGIDCVWSFEGSLAVISYYITGMGAIINSGLNSAAPFIDGVGNGPVLGDPSSPSAAVMTGSFPGAVDEHTLVKCTGIYEGFNGNIRLSGAAVPGEQFYFNFIFDMYLKIPADGKNPMDDTNQNTKDIAVDFDAEEGSDASVAFINSAAIVISSVVCLLLI